MAQQIPFSFFGQGETLASLGSLTMNPTNVELTNFDTICEVTDEGGGVVTDTGICWSTNPNPTVADNFKSSGGGGVGPFTVDILDIDGLLNDTTYYFRAYATNLYGQSYSSQVVQTTSYVPFITEWTTANPGDSINIMRSPSGGYSVNAYVDWGDGSAIENVIGNTNSTITHPYAAAGTYEVKVSGTFPKVSMGSQDELTDIKQWGTQPWKELVAAFREGNYFTYTATDSPVLTDLVNTSFENMFRRGIAFGGPFTGNASFNSWDVSLVTDTSFMFNGTSFNQDISGWNVSNIEDMSYMFRYVPFNQDISGWNTSSLQNVQSMFQGTAVTAVFDQDISLWDISNVTNFSNFLNGTTSFSTANYDALLVAWEAQGPATNMFIDFGSTQYTLGGAAEAAHTSLGTTYIWTINDGGGV